MTQLTFRGETLVPGTAAGPILFADLGLSFWGGINAESGGVIDAQHPLHGKSVAGKVLVIPSGRGSCSGSAILLELIARGNAPAAIIFCETEVILPLGAIVSEALFGTTVPMVRLHRSAFEYLGQCSAAVVGDGEVKVLCGANSAIVADLPEFPEVELELEDNDRLAMDDDSMPARQLAMRIVVAVAKLQGARRLIDVTQCHLDCCIYTGPVSVAIAERMRDLGARVKVPTTLNAISIDRKRWQAFGMPPDRAREVERQTEAYLAMGARPSYTCAPYLLDTAPGQGEDIGWAESNAVVFANSVLGARTEKYPDYLDLCVALTGRAPQSGCHIPVYRRARLHIHVTPPPDADDAFFPLLGYLAGTLSPNAVPVLTGLEKAAPTRDALKAFSAAFGTTSAAPMFHMVGITPEAPALEAVFDVNADSEPVRVGTHELLQLWKKINGPELTPVSCVAIGNPHASLEELAAIAYHCRGRKKAAGTEAIVTTSRTMHDQAQTAGFVPIIEEFGFRFLTDTCWCMIEEPVIPDTPGAIVTNSGKYVHYGPGLTGKRVRLGNLAACVDAAVVGSFSGRPPQWLGSS